LPSPEEEGAGSVIPHITNVEARNYKSLSNVPVSLGPLTVLVGPNGAGKSNFIDVLAFVRDCLNDSIELALKNRGGASAVRRASQRRARRPSISITLHMELGQGATAHYSFELAWRAAGAFSIAREQCAICESPAIGPTHGFDRTGESFTQAIPGVKPQLKPDRLALFAASGTDEFRPVWNFLTAMRFYSIEPRQLRDLQDPDSGESLKRDGSNAAAVLNRLRRELPPTQYERLCRLLAIVAAGIEDVAYRQMRSKETLEFQQRVGPAAEDYWTLDALNMSDGTLRVLGILLALFQPTPPTVIAFEEPESTVHPAVTELLVELFLDASRQRQVLLTTHSPDLLDSKDLSDEQIRSVVMRDGQTYVTRVSGATRQAIRERLYTAGELLRLGEIEPDPGALHDGQANGAT